MRFLTGLILGVLLTLGAASVLQTFTHPIIELVTIRVTSAWESLLDATSEALFELPRQPALIEPQLESQDLSADPVMDATPVALSEFQAPPAADDSPPVEEPPLLASAWFPFHSEVSARGFARRLSAELDYPFDVERIGPGAYQVVYGYLSVDERAGLETRIAEATGQ